ncbi:hypothetical protein GCK72_018784 [Caenorhabditis remanei]|uniref:Uncharacterized protein n=1 Tax=Caenorhabditis remanei TaxID=31234 RepID=A0A6A5GB34_CAERE|nr:hypothetical protein GCK72_018784 [Caenorhabditis remanei]KAF1752230.1 hypothetical protein GCK72_018784 [Caenorhabditis remanei]
MSRMLRNKMPIAHFTNDSAALDTFRWSPRTSSKNLRVSGGEEPKWSEAILNRDENNTLRYKVISCFLISDHRRISELETTSVNEYHHW